MLTQAGLCVEHGTLRALGKPFHAVKNDLLMTLSVHGHR